MEKNADKYTNVLRATPMVGYAPNETGLANSKTIDIKEGEDGLVVTKKTGPANKPKQATSSTNLPCRGSLTIKEATKQTAGYRGDLKKAARIRASAICKSLRVKKASRTK